MLVYNGVTYIEKAKEVELVVSRDNTSVWVTIDGKLTLSIHNVSEAVSLYLPQPAGVHVLKSKLQPKEEQAANE
jgi:hypothetical protein